MNIFAAAWTRISHAFSAIQASAISFADPLITGIEKMGEDALIIIATAVLDSEKLGGSSDEKFAHARTAIVPQLEAAGIIFTKNILNGAVEAAVAHLRKETAAAPIPTPAPTPAPTSAPAPAPASSVAAILSALSAGR